MKTIEYDEMLTVMPHKGKMVLLSRITNYDLKERTIEAEYDITDKCIFYDPQISGVPTWVGFEFIAQTVSALSGLTERVKDKPPRLGFVLGLSQVQINIPFLKTGSIIKIKTKEVENVHPIIYFTGELYLDDKKVFSGRLTIMDVDDEQQERFMEIITNG